PYSTIDKPNATTTYAYGINSAGQIVGDYEDNVGSGTHGYLLSGGLFTTVDDPLGPHGTVATGINKSGQIVGYYYDANSAEAGFLYNPSDGSFTTLKDPAASNYTIALGINDQGQIVGRYQTADFHYHGFLYTNGIYTTIDAPNGVSRACTHK